MEEKQKRLQLLKDSTNHVEISRPEHSLGATTITITDPHGTQEETAGDDNQQEATDSNKAAAANGTEIRQTCVEMAAVQQVPDDFVMVKIKKELNDAYQGDDDEETGFQVIYTSDEVRRDAPPVGESIGTHVVDSSILLSTLGTEDFFDAQTVTGVDSEDGRIESSKESELRRLLAEHPLPPLHRFPDAILEPMMLNERRESSSSIHRTSTEENDTLAGNLKFPDPPSEAVKSEAEFTIRKKWIRRMTADGPRLVLKIKNERIENHRRHQRIKSMPDPRYREAVVKKKLQMLTADSDRIYPKSLIDVASSFGDCELKKQEASTSYKPEVTSDGPKFAPNGMEIPDFKTPADVSRFTLLFTKRDGTSHDFDHLYTLHTIHEKCKSCKRFFDRKESLLLHAPCYRRKRGVQRSGVADIKYPCNVCGISFWSMNRLREHTKGHIDPPPYECLFLSGPRKIKCGKRSYSEEQARIHGWTHVGLKPHFCTWGNCGRRYSSQQVVKEHIVRDHLKIKPYLCNNCDFSSPVYSCLKSHEMTHQDKNQRERYKCRQPGCQRSYLNDYNMRCHMRQKHPILFRKIRKELMAEVYARKKVISGIIDVEQNEAVILKNPDISPEEAEFRRCKNKGWVDLKYCMTHQISTS